MKHIIIATILVLIFSACGGGSPEPPQPPPPPPPPELTRSFNMGFTPWLYEATINAQDVTYERLIQHGDMVKHHLMSGIPWQEALDQSAYHPNVEGEINGRLDRTPSGTQIFLAIDALNSGRDELVPNWGESVNMPLEGDWANRSWSSQEVITAYINFAIDMIDRFQPTHFEYGTEVSELILNDPAGYLEFLVFAEAVHTSLSILYPDLKLMTSVAIKSPASDEMQLIEASMSSIMPFTDVLGISAYPYVFFNHDDRGDPANLPSDWLMQVNTIADGKPLAMSETGWIGESLDIPEFQYSEVSDPTKQAAYMTVLLQAAEDMNLEFVIWWTVTDFDTLWNDTLAQDPIAKIWKDIGLYDQDQMARNSLQTWDSWLNRSYQASE